MAKTETTAPAPAPAPSPAPAPAAKAPAPKSLPTPEAPVTRVVQWGNGEPVEPGAAAEEQESSFSAVDKGNDFLEGSGEEGEAQEASGEEDDVVYRPGKATGVEGEPAAEEGEQKEETAPPTETPAEKRSAVLARLAAERKLREQEGVIAQERRRAQAAEDQLRGYQTGTLGARLARLGITTEEQRQELAEAILLGKDEVKFTEPPKPSADDRVTQLERQLEEERTQKENAAKLANYHRGLDATQQNLADLDLPHISFVARRDGLARFDRNGNTVRAGWARVMERGRELWDQAGRTGDPKQHIRTAAKEIEAQYRAEHEALGVTLAPKRQAPGAPAQAAARPPRVGTGSQTRGARSPVTRPLPLDPAERDAAIKRDFFGGR